MRERPGGGGCSWPSSHAAAAKKPAPSAQLLYPLPIGPIREAYGIASHASYFVASSSRSLSTARGGRCILQCILLDLDFDPPLHREMADRKGHQWTFAFTLKWRRFLRPLLIDKEEDVWQALWRSALAEFFGTLIFVFLGTAAVTSSSRLIANAASHIAGGNASAAFLASMVSSPVSQLILIAFGFGFSLTVVIYAIGEISGGAPSLSSFPTHIVSGSDGLIHSVARTN